MIVTVQFTLTFSALLQAAIVKASITNAIARAATLIFFIFNLQNVIIKTIIIIL